MDQPTTLQSLSRLACALLAALWLAASAPAFAETSSTCTDFIESVPAVIGMQGVWCLHGNVSTAQTTGAAIEITANNVTIDCNGFKIGGLAAGNLSSAVGINAYNRKNVVVRNCNIRGFHQGIVLAGGGGTQDHSAGHLVEDNRVDNSLSTGIRVHPGHGHMVRRNRVFDTGGATDTVYAVGIYATNADVIDNVVSGLFPVLNNGSGRGISASGGGVVVRGNVVRDVTATGESRPTGIQVVGRGVRVSDNIVQTPMSVGTGIWSLDASTYCIRNIVGGFDSAFSCTDGGGNHAY